MAVELAGTSGNTASGTRSSSGTGSMAVTVPADADMMVVTFRGWLGGSTALIPDELNFDDGGTVDFTTIATSLFNNVPDDDGTRSWYMLSTDGNWPGTGAATLYFNVPNNPSEGVHVDVVFLKNVDLTSPIKESDEQYPAGTGESSWTPTLPSRAAGDMVFIAGYDYNSTRTVSTGSTTHYDARFNDCDGYTYTWDGGVGTSPSLSNGDYLNAVAFTVTQTPNSREFNNSNSNYLSTTSPAAAITDYPILMHAKVRMTAAIDASGYAFCYLGRSAGSNGFLGIGAQRISSVDYIFAHAQDTSGVNSYAFLRPGASYDNFTVQNVWLSVWGYFESNSERHIWIVEEDGTEWTDDESTTRNAGTLDRLGVGIARSSLAFWPMDGQIKDVAIWDLDDSWWGANAAARKTKVESVVTALGTDYSPRVYSDGLVHAYDMENAGNETDQVGSADLTETGTVAQSGEIPDPYNEYPASPPSAGAEPTLSDGASAGDSVAAQAAKLATLADGASAGDSLSATRAGLATLTDGGSAGDSASALVGRVAAATDGSVAGDSVAAAGGFVTTLSDGAEAGDSLVSLAGYLGTASDGAVVGDSVSAIAAFDAAIADGSSAGDSASFLAGYLATISDGSDAGDSTNTLAAGEAAVSDGASAGDSAAVLAAKQASLSDGADAGESISALAALLATLSDGATAGDSVASLAGLASTLDDGSLTGDSTATSVGFQVTTSDGVVASDNVSELAGLVGIASDGATASDSVSPDAALLAGISDGAIAGDSVAEIAGQITTLSDGASAGDSVAIYVIYVGFVMDAEQIIQEMVQAQIIALADPASGRTMMELLGLPADGSEVRIRKFPWSRDKVFPGITIHPLTESLGIGTCNSDDVGYGVGVTFVQKTGDGMEDLVRIRRFRQLMRGGFLTKKLTSETVCVWQVLIEHGPWIMPKHYRDHYDYSALVLRCWSEQERI